MNIIIVSKNMARARTLNLWQAVGLLAGVVAVSSSLLIGFILPKGDGPLEVVNPARLLPEKFRLQQQDNREHLNALAVQLGQIQARVIRLDALSERLARLAGVKEKDLAKDEDGRGGPMVRAHDPSSEDIQQQLQQLMAELEQRSDRLGVLEAMLLQKNLKSETLPSKMPVSAGSQSSGFGWRVDPFTGQMALHEGLDFVAENGTPIQAAASGIVVAAEHTPDYGNLVKVDHGTGVETRYAHASKILVKPGERVEKGQIIAEVGNTGRSTGAHLHFEVRLNGVALDPRKYLSKQNASPS
jgi:murein DD-endopeptidase MepM/ murein hydrolase activator NlpD